MNPAAPDGVLLVDKAEGMTSHDVVALVRRRLEIKKVGHCGTLDPIATGLLLLTIGRGTKIQDLLMSEDKEYSGTLILGVSTTTQDREGEAIETRPVPSLTEEEIRAAFDKFRGDFYQMPPMVSAIKHGGVPLYKLAREGKTVEREPRLVHVYRYSIDRIRLPEIDFTVICSKGFYVRTYAHDIGDALGCGGHLKNLRRTKSGRFSVDGTITVDQIRKLSAGRDTKADAQSARSVTATRSVTVNDEARMTDDEPNDEIHRQRTKEDSFWDYSGIGSVVRESPPESKIYDLEERTACFGERVIAFARKVPQDPVTNRIINQLVGAGTSVGANYVEADDAVSKKEFLKNIATCKKETRETKHFLRMAVSAVPHLKEEARELWLEARSLHLIFAKIWRSGKDS